MNYFEILKLPIAYKIDVDLLTRNYFSSLRDSKDSVGLGLLNEAYSVLKSDIKRAEYFLNLKNISTEQISSKLAIRMFEMREKYEACGNRAEKIEFQNKTKSKIKELVLALKKNEKNLDKFSEIFSELKFLNSFLEKARSDVYSRD